MLIFTTDKPRLLRHFQKDPVLFSYHIGDLDDFYFSYCQWGALYHLTRAKIEEVVLTYTGCDTPTVLAFGVDDRFQELLNDIVDLLPPKFYCHFFERDRSVFLKNYKETYLGKHFKMKLTDNDSIQAIDINILNIVNLENKNLNELKKFYSQAYPENYFTERMLETGKYYAVTENEKIVSVTGVHVDSDEYKITVLGNIATLPEYRGKGYATASTAFLLKQLDLSERLICLNVKADNEAAISSYKKLGFEIIHEYEESIFVLK